MIHALILDADRREAEELRGSFRRMTAFYTDEKMDFKMFFNGSSLIRELGGVERLEAAAVDVTVPGGVESAKRVRARFPHAELLIIASQAVSPMKYLNPSICASALLLRPAQPEWEDVIRDFFIRLLGDEDSARARGELWVKDKNGMQRFPFEQICYLEAREKKIFIRTRAEECGVRGTLEQFAEKLPGSFRQCQRSYIVNTDRIERVSRGEGRLYLGGDLWVPFSRSYREAVRGFLN